MKAIMIIATMFLFGCASKEINLYGDAPKNDSEIAILDSSCDKKCEASIKESINVNDQEYQVGEIIVLSINGKYGTGTFYDDRGAFNATWDGAFKIKVNPGKQDILSKPNYYRAHPLMERKFSFEAEEGSQYFVGRLLILSGKSYDDSYAWTPVVMNKTTSSIIYPEGKPEWQGENIQSVPIYVPIVY
ncbi:MAG: hypothetical protein JAZ06_01680 [Candidatus Thiodiazotropha taylori]|nr:hypothetical protein [Candidatus Thiodiazotropha taylori]